MFKAGFTTKGKSGNGLGLIYSANVINAHGGQINAVNRPEGGAEIAISLPCSVVH
jgi:signal transduction histidine kinase